VSETVSIACECLTAGCVQLLEIPRDAYRAVHEHPRAFVVLPGHVEDGVERVVSSHDGYSVVQAVGRVPRSRTRLPAQDDMPTDDAAQARKVWLLQLAEGARLAAERPQPPWLYDDLKALDVRLRAEAEHLGSLEDPNRAASS
jgi:hypothetical protein